MSPAGSKNPTLAWCLAVLLSLVLLYMTVMAWIIFLGGPLHPIPDKYSPASARWSVEDGVRAAILSMVATVAILILRTSWRRRARTFNVE